MLDLDIVILGGGWAGALYGLESKLNHPNSNIVILEKRKMIGGLLRSETINGHVFDIGGSHIIFSRNRTVLNRMLEMLNENVLELTRKSFVMLNHQLIPYPVENNLNALSQEDKITALVSFLEAWEARPSDYIPRNLSEWIRAFFGKWLAENYLVPYNLKIWKRPLEEIDVDWVYTPGRLPIPDWRDVVKSAMGQPTIGYSEQFRFYYPKCGGICALFRSVIKRASNVGVHYIRGYKIETIKRVEGGWVINDNIFARKLVSSIPLKEFVNLIEAPEHVIKLSKQLDYNKLLVVGLAIDRPAPAQHWVYVPERDVIFHRYSWISNYSPFNAPRNKSTLIAEITIPHNQLVNAEKCVEETLNGLKELGVIKDDKEVLFVKSWLHEYAYPLHTVTSNKARDQIIQWLSEQGVTYIGRWGCWQYWNMDKVYENILITLERG